MLYVMSTETIKESSTTEIELTESCSIKSDTSLLNKSEINNNACSELDDLNNQLDPTIYNYKKWLSSNGTKKIENKNVNQISKMDDLIANENSPTALKNDGERKSSRLRTQTLKNIKSDVISKNSASSILKQMINSRRNTKRTNSRVSDASPSPKRNRKSSKQRKSIIGRKTPVKPISMLQKKKK